MLPYLGSILPTVDPHGENEKTVHSAPARYGIALDRPKIWPIVVREHEDRVFVA
jgi:hypothetical protein